jgi:heme-degrading monooxygenase HmoA
MASKPYILDKQGYSGFSFKEPEGHGPIEVRLAHNVREDKDAIYIGWWETKQKFPKGQLEDAFLYAHSLGEEMDAPVEVVTKGKRNTTIILARTA